jgi:hypothetical protein
MNKLDENKMWEIIDLVISEEVKENEAIKSMPWGGVQLKYSAIISNKLVRSSVMVDTSTLRLMQIPLLRSFIKGIIEELRDSAD